MKKMCYNNIYKGIYEVKPKMIKEWRVKIGISQIELSKMLDIAPMTIYRWEKGIEKPTPANRRKLLKLMKRFEKR